MIDSIVIFLCDYTGIAADPWLKAGYHCILVDPQHKKTGKDKNIYKISGTIIEAMPALIKIIKKYHISFVA